LALHRESVSSQTSAQKRVAYTTDSQSVVGLAKTTRKPCYRERYRAMLRLTAAMTVHDHNAAARRERGLAQCSKLQRTITTY